MGASIQDVADRAGVSIATVSRTFTLPDKVLPQTREKVLKVAQDLDYTISRSASALKSGKSARIALLTGGELDSWYDSHVLAGLNSILHDAGYDIALYAVSDEQERHAFFSDMSIKRNADAVLVVSFQIPCTEADKLATTGIPLIGINTEPIPEFSATIGIDETSCMELVINHLVNLGHRKIAYVCLDPETEHFKWNGQARLRAFRSICSKLGDRVNPTVVYAPKDDTRADFALSQLARLDQHPTAIICMNDEYALPLLFCMQRSGYTIPRDVSVAGFDDSTYAHEIGLTTIHQDPYEMGKSSAQTLLKLLEGENPDMNMQIQPSFLAVRNTTAPPEH